MENKLINYNLDQYYFERDIFVQFFNEYAPSFYDYSAENGDHFDTCNFHFYRFEEEFYLHHRDTGIVINWYKHLGRTNTCNRNITHEIFRDLLMILELDIERIIGISQNET